MSSIPRISVELTEDKKKMTVEWHRWLETLGPSNSSGGATTGGVTLAQYNALQAQINALDTVIVSYEARIKALEGGYQT